MGAAGSELNESEVNFTQFSTVSNSLDKNGRIEFEAKSFEQLLKVVAQNWEGDEQKMSSDPRFIDILNSPIQSYQEGVNEQKLLTMLKNKGRPPNIMREMKNDLNYKVRQRYGLDKPILTTGVIEFESYEAKLKMLLSPIYKFGKQGSAQDCFTSSVILNSSIAISLM